jgi:hypothetical protein
MHLYLMQEIARQHLGGLRGQHGCGARLGPATAPR